MLHMPKRHRHVDTEKTLSAMRQFLIRRLIQAIITLFGVMAVSFGVLYLMPGNPVLALVGTLPGGVNAHLMAELDKKFGLNQSIPEQFVHYMGAVLSGHLGTSISYARPVSTLIWQALPNTLELAAVAMVIAAFIGIGIGVFSASRQGSWTDRVSILGSLLGISMPSFLLGMLAILLFAVRLQWLPAFGIGGFKYLILPGAVLGIGSAAALARITRSTMLDTLGKQYVITARAKGLPERSVIGEHALRNALIPVVTLLGLQFGYLIGGAVVMESLFDRPGIGSLLVNAVLSKDVPLLRATILLIATGYVFLNLLVDLSYAWIDPRIRLS